MRRYNLLIIFFVGLIVVAQGYLGYKMWGANKSATLYNWMGIDVQAFGPKDDLAASWGPVQATRDEILVRLPVKEKPKMDNALEQASADGQYYFDFLTTSMNFLTEKSINYYAKQDGMDRKAWIEKVIGTYDSADEDFADWKKENNIGSQFSPSQEKNIKLELEQNWKLSEIRKYLNKTAKAPLQIYTEVPTNKLDINYEGIAYVGQGKATATFICDLVSPACFSSLDIVKRISKDLKIKLSFKPAIVGDDFYPQIRIKFGMCIASINNEAFWIFYSNLASQPPRLEENELYPLSGLEGDNLSKLRGCIMDQGLQKEWEEHKKFFLSLGKPVIPSVIIDGEPILGVFSYERAAEVTARRYK